MEEQNVSRRAFLCAVGLGLISVAAAPTVASANPLIGLAAPEVGAIIAAAIAVLFGTVSLAPSPDDAARIGNQFNTWIAAVGSSFADTLGTFVSGVQSAGKIAWSSISTAVFNALQAFNGWLLSLSAGSTELKIDGYPAISANFMPTDKINQFFTGTGADDFAPNENLPVITGTVPATADGGRPYARAGLAQRINESYSNLTFFDGTKSHTFSNVGCVILSYYIPDKKWYLSYNGTYVRGSGDFFDDDIARNIELLRIHSLLSPVTADGKWGGILSADNQSLDTTKLYVNAGRAVLLIGTSTESGDLYFDGANTIGAWVIGKNSSEFIKRKEFQGDVLIDGSSVGWTTAPDFPADVFPDGVSGDKGVGADVTVGADGKITDAGTIALPDVIGGSYADVLNGTQTGVITDGTTVGVDATTNSTAIAGGAAGTVTESIGALIGGLDGSGFFSSNTSLSNSWLPFKTTDLDLDVFPFNLPKKIQQIFEAFHSKKGQANYEFRMPFLDYGDFVCDLTPYVNYLKPYTRLASKITAGVAFASAVYKRFIGSSATVGDDQNES